jgi:hypothetical protein
MGILGLFRKDEIIGAKVLVCALETRFDDLLKGDSEAYMRHYPATDTAIFPNISGLMDGVGQRYDIVHLLCDVTPSGTIMDGSGKEIAGTELIQRRCDTNVKLLWIASDNPPERYIKGFGARGKRLNLVMTLRRKDPEFQNFLRELLFRMFYGDSMPVAWVDLVPQIPGLSHPDAPALIFFAGRGAVKLR